MWEKNWYAKSPFENRIALLIGIPLTHPAYDFICYRYEIFGCLLTRGFNENSLH